MRKLQSAHGGNDPGKIAVDGTPEKEINLSIAKKLRDYLEASDVEVILTREDDRGLYEDMSYNQTDLRYYDPTNGKSVKANRKKLESEFKQAGSVYYGYAN